MIKVFHSKNHITSSIFGKLLFSLLVFVLGSADILLAQTSFTTAGTNTYTVPVGITRVKIECWGGGGGGGSTITNNNMQCGGGGGGAYASDLVDVTGLTTISLNVGNGGNASENGGNSYYGTLVVAAGGKGAPSGQFTAGEGGLAINSTGFTTFSGGNGADGRISNDPTPRYSGGGGGGAGSTGNGANASANIAGIATTFNGGAGGNGLFSTSGVGSPGYIYGGGGGGAYRRSNGPYEGGKGASGLIVVTPMTVQVDATLGASQGFYANLKGALDAINSGTHMGVLTIKILGSTVETASAVLNQSGTGSASYASILIYPENPDVTVSGNFNGALLHLNGADNVTINGSLLLTNAFPTLTFVNNNTGAGASTIFFSQDATSNRISYTAIKGVAASATTGVVVFSTSSAGGAGNDGNIIEFCKISGTGNTASTRPFNAIYSNGTSGRENSGNQFNDNDIFNFLNHANESNGIRLDANTTNCTISGNNFYETSTLTTTAAVAHRAIYLNNTAGIFTIQGNYIGGSGAKASGVWTKNGNDNVFYGIYLNGSNATASSIQGNVIRNMNYTNSANKTWTGIHVEAGKANIGTLVGDTIGSGVGTGSILLNNSTANGALYGMYVASTDLVLIQNNTIGSITTSNANAANSTSIYGVFKANVAGAVVILSNTVGGPTTPNSIYASSLATGSVQHLMGIYSSSSTSSLVQDNEVSNLANATTSNQVSLTRGIRTANGANVVSGNTVHDLSSFSTNGGNYLTTQLIGIDQISEAAGTSQLVQGNTVYALKNITDVKIEMYGIFYRGPSTGTNVIDRNFIHTFIIVSTNLAYLHGLSIESGACMVTNNVIFLGNNITTGCFIWGIWTASSSDMQFYHNTSYLSGQATTGTSNTYAFRDISVGSTSRILKNNIFWNARYNSNATVSHFALYFANENGTLTINSNDYQYTQGFAQISGSTYAAFTTLWRAGYDANSLNKDPLLTNLGGTQASDYQPRTTLDCPKLTEVDVDFGYQTRPSTATMGAWEYSANPVEIWKGGIKQNSFPNLKGAFDAINAGSHTGGLVVKITSNTNETAPAVLYNSGNTDAGRNSDYTYVVIHPTRTEIQVKGNVPGALVDLNGADNVRFDGRVNLAGSNPELHLINTSLDPTASTLRFLNSAESDTIQYCYLKGSSPSATSAILHLSTSATGNGNDNNLIRYCRLTNPGIGESARVYNALYSYGTSGRDNSGVQISNNYFYDFRSESTNSNGILVDANSTDFIISGNSFYSTSTMNATANLTIRGIAIENAMGNNFVISGNFIGGQAPQCQGYMLGLGTSNARLLVYYPIYLNVGTTTATSVQGNQIGNFHCLSTSAAPFAGIYLHAGAFQVGTITGNVIGANTGTGNILLSGSLSSLATSYGIYVNTTGDAQISNNSIGGITTSNIVATRGHSFYGIFKPNVSGTLSINGNLIGSLSTAQSLNASSASSTDAQVIRGVYSLGSGIVSINANTIANLVNGSTRPNAANSVFGVWIENNGLIQATLDRNFIYDLSSSSISTANLVVGFYLAGGPVMLTNNIISLGYGKAYNYYMMGIYDVGLANQTSTIYHNTSYISGAYSFAGTTATAYSAAYFKANNAGATILRNNIFYNNASSGSSRQYALYFANASGGGSLTVDNNDYFTTGSYTGYYLGGRKSGSTIVTGQDLNSRNVNPQFVNAYSIDRAGYMPTIDLFGATGTGVLTDHGQYTRSTTSPCMGAWERINKWKGSVSIDFNTPANWTAGAVPSIWENVVFDENPLRPCLMDQQRYVTDIVNAQSAYRFVLNGFRLNLKGQFVFSNGAQVDATTSGSTLSYVGTSPQVLQSTSLFNNTVYNLEVNNSTNVTLSGSLKLLNALSATSGKLIASNSGTTLQFEGSTAQTLSGSALLDNKLYNLVVNNPFHATLVGTLKLLNTLTATSGKLNASNSGATLQFEGTSAQVLDGNALLDNKLYDLVVNNASNVSLSGTLVLLNALTAPAGRLNTLTGSTVVYFGSTPQVLAGNCYLNERAFNLTASNPFGLVLNNSFTVDNNLTISTGSGLTISETKGLTVSGLVTNNAGTPGLLLKSSALGTASLIQSTSSIPATVERYIDGDTCAWHFMSSPVAAQPISGSWTPSGTFGDGTGYDLYAWDEPASCWVYNLNEDVTPTWSSIHAINNFIPGRGYLYAVQALTPTKQFAGILNAGSVSQNVTMNATGVYQGFNLLGNPYSSSMDWNMAVGFDRNMLDANGGGYFLWTWSTTANNYGVYNSADPDGVGTNNVSRYIAPMQSFFVKAVSAGTFAFHQSGRVHDGASVWLKSAKAMPTSQDVRLSVSSSAGRDEIKFDFGYGANQAGAMKLFSPVLTAPSLYMNCAGVSYSTRHLTDVQSNNYIPVNFKAGKAGMYTLNCTYDLTNAGPIFLEDRQIGTILDFSGGDGYTFEASLTDAPERFVLHFGSVTPIEAAIKPNVWVNASELNVYLENMIGDYTMRVSDLQGRQMFIKKMSGSEQCSVPLYARGVYVVTVKGRSNMHSVKVVY